MSALPSPFKKAMRDHPLPGLQLCVQRSSSFKTPRRRRLSNDDSDVFSVLSQRNTKCFDDESVVCSIPSSLQLSKLGAGRLPELVWSPLDPHPLRTPASPMARPMTSPFKRSRSQMGWGQESTTPEKLGRVADDRVFMLARERRRHASLAPLA